jgi:hypothetical protein
MHFFKRKAMYPRRRTDETKRVIDKLFKDYAAHVKTIRGSLAQGARALSSLSFHDATIKALRHVSRKEVQIVIEGGAYDIVSEKMLEYGAYTLSFIGVRKAWVPNAIVGDTWLYEEMHLSDDGGFDYQVLLVGDEIRIQADDVRLTHISKSSGELS